MKIQGTTQVQAPRRDAPASQASGGRTFASTLAEKAQGTAPRTWLAPLRHLEADRTRLDGLMQAALDGRRFSPGQLLALQCGVHRLNTELELAAKVVEQSHAAVRRALSTEV